MKQSNQGTLNKTDWKKWAKNIAIFSSPALLAFMVSLQSGGSLEFASGAAYSALLAAGIDLTRKFIAGEK